MSRLVSMIMAISLLGCAKNAAKGTQNTAENGDDVDADAPVEPLVFSMTAPTSGAILDADSVTAEGSWSGGVDTVVHVNGVDVGSAGVWSVDVPHASVAWPDSPLWPVLGNAQDAEGSWARARATLIQGASTSALDPIENGLAFRLTDNVLGQLDAVLDTVVADVDLTELLVSEDPVVTTSLADLYILGGSFGDLIPTIDFTAEGLAYSLRVEAVVIDLLVDLGGINFDADLEADAVIVSGTLTFGVDGSGGLTVTPGETDVETENLEVFGLTDSFGLVDLLLGDTLATTIEEQLVGALDGLIEAQEDLRYLEFSGIAVVSDFVEAAHDDSGVTILADSRIELADGTVPGDRLSTDVPFVIPTGTSSPGGVDYQAGLFLDDDLLSALGAALSAGDLLEQDVAGDLGSLSLDTTLLGAIIPAFATLPSGQPVSISTRPTVPLVGTAGSDGYAGALHLGGLELDLKTDQDGDGTEDVVMTMVLDAIVGLAPGEEEELISIDLVDSRATLLSTSLEADLDETEAGLSALIDIAVPALVNNLLGDALDLSLGGIELQIVDGAGVDDRAALFLDLDLSGLEI
ncbi:MAG: hypothetical protein CL927_06850 [Deltaproteobacteria bacterium]|nr:hypothetical protein [Deltaproteobacteria bacterium]HCH66308.1 hypothetical protein [Deltaproteobacteria bacterium]